MDQAQRTAAVAAVAAYTADDWRGIAAQVDTEDSMWQDADSHDRKSPTALRWMADVYEAWNQSDSILAGDGYGSVTDATLRTLQALHSQRLQEIAEGAV